MKGDVGDDLAFDGEAGLAEAPGAGDAGARRGGQRDPGAGAADRS